MARLYKRGRVWWCWGYDANRARWVESTRQTDRKAAELVAREIERRQTSVDGAPTDPLSIEQALIDVIAARKREGKAETTIRNYHRNGGHIVRVLRRNTDARALTLAHLEGYIDRRLAEGAHRSTIDVELRTLSAALRYAAKHGKYRGDLRSIWPKDALAGAHVPGERWLTRDEYAKLLAGLVKSRRCYVIAYVNTGCRRTELWRIEPRDVNLDTGMLHVRGTKTAGADRWIPISDELRPILVERMATSRGPVFPKWYETKPLQWACRRAKIPPVSCNDLRRTFASWLAQAGVPMLVTARMMGHVSTKMIERVYAKLGQDDMRSAIAKLAVANASQDLARDPK